MVIWRKLTIDIISDGVYSRCSSVLCGSEEVLEGNDVPVEATDLWHVDRVGDVVQDERVDVVIPVSILPLPIQNINFIKYEN